MVSVLVTKMVTKLNLQDSKGGDITTHNFIILMITSSYE